MTANINPTTGIRYGVIAGNSLDPDVLGELMYGGGAKDLSYADAISQLTGEVTRDADALEEAAKETAHQRTPNPSEDLIADEIEAVYVGLGYQDRDDYIETRVDREREYIQCDEPEIEGELDGVKYRVGWLGGAPLVWAIDGLEGVANRLCSPCVPNAADLDGGFILGDEMEEETDYSHHYACHCVPRDWLAKED